MPVLLLWADRDPLYPLRVAEEALRLLPDAQLRVLAGTGFLMAYDDPVGLARAGSLLRVVPKQQFRAACEVSGPQIGPAFAKALVRLPGCSIRMCGSRPRAPRAMSLSVSPTIHEAPSSRPIAPAASEHPGRGLAAGTARQALAGRPPGGAGTDAKPSTDALLRQQSSTRAAPRWIRSSGTVPLAAAG